MARPKRLDILSTLHRADGFGCLPHGQIDDLELKDLELKDLELKDLEDVAK